MTGTNMLGRYMESEALREDGETVPLEMIVTKTNLSDRVFLDLKKIASGNFELDKTTHPLYAIAGTAVSSLINIGSQNGVKLELQGNSDITVSCDRDRMIQVSNNLISNAIKFSPKDATVKVSIELSSDNTKVRCSVIDKGPGIAVNDMPKLFAMFQQVGQRPAGASKGTGLGLAISKALIEQHGGTIGIDSSLGSGSVFWFELPLAGTKDRPVD